MLGSAQITLTGSLDVGRLTFRRAGKACPAYRQDPIGTGAQR